jgi:hypothetical protein
MKSKEEVRVIDRQEESARMSWLSSGFPLSLSTA